MRLTRLRRAVANREFEDAILVQPGKLDPEIAALANPESRKLIEAADKARRSRKANKISGSSELSAEIVLDSDSELSDQLESNKEISPCRTSPEATKRPSKRKASSEPCDESDDETLFYKDTSSTSRRDKQIKLEDGRGKHLKVEEPTDAGKTIPQAKKPARDAPTLENMFSASNGEKPEGLFVAENRKTGLQRFPNPIDIGPVHSNQNLIPMQGILTPQQWHALQNSRRAGMIRRDIGNTLHGAYLNQRASHPSRQPVRPSAAYTINGDRFGDGECRPTWNLPPSSPLQNQPSRSPTVDDTKSALSSPASVFSHFRPPKPSAYAAANPATKRVIIPKDQRAQLPGKHELPQHPLDPALRSAKPQTRDEPFANRSSAKRMTMGPRQSSTPAEQVQKVKKEDKRKAASIERQ